MGPGKAQTPPYNGPDFHHRSVLCAFPSPASVSDSLNSPTLQHDLQSDQPNPEHLSTRDGHLEAVSILPTEPGEIMISSIVTPPASERPEPDMNFIVGGALAPVHSTPPSWPTPRSRPGLQLPSFELLGIAAPHPDRFGGLDGALANISGESMQHTLTSEYGDFGVLSAFADVTPGTSAQDVLSNPAIEKPRGCAIQSPVRHYVDTITPPAEIGYPHWHSMATVTSAMDSPSTDPGNVAPSTNNVPIAAGAAISGLEPRRSTNHAEADDSRSWIDGAIDVLVANLRTMPRTDSLMILSHALPSPSHTGHIYSEVISAIRSSTPSNSSPMTWINVFHAITGRFNLQDLPRSPPTTPGPAVGGEDYFTEKVFDSAVSIADYQDDLSHLPRSPRPVVPPSSIDVSIVERYIPPSTSKEFESMFEPNGHSILVDRLVELSPNNGSLLFIYPTKAGAETFTREYLGPVLDPSIRSMGVVHGLSAELNAALGSMVAVNNLPSHESLHHSISTLCARLTQRSSAAERFHGRRPSLTLSYASRQYVKLSREAWAQDWWIKQEKPRIRAAVTRYAREIQMRPSHEHSERPTTSTELLQTLLDDVVRKQYQHGQEPERGVEVSMFVITRTS